MNQEMFCAIFRNIACYAMKVFARSSLLEAFIAYATFARDIRREPLGTLCSNVFFYARRIFAHGKSYMLGYASITCIF